MQLPIPHTLRRFTILSLVLASVAVAAWVIFDKVLHWGDPYDYMILPNYWIDFNIYRPIFADYGTHRFLDWHGTTCYQYPAPVALLYAVMYALPRGARGMQALIIAVVLTGAICLCRALVRRGLAMGSAAMFVGLAVICSYPMWFELRVLNSEIFLFTIGMLAFYAFHQEKYELCGLLLGLDVGFKVYPGLFLLLLILHKKYRAAVLGVVTAIVLNVLGLLYITPADSRFTVAGLRLSQIHVQRNIATYTADMYASLLGNRFAMYDHGIWQATKLLLLKALHLPWPTGLLHGYYLVVIVVGSALYWTRLRVLPVVNQVMCLTAAAAFLTPSSFDYTLLWLYIGWAWLVLFTLEHRDATVKGVRGAFTCYAVILSFLSEFIVRARGWAGPMRATTALIFFYIVLRYPFAVQSGLVPETTEDWEPLQSTGKSTRLAM